MDSANIVETSSAGTGPLVILPSVFVQFGSELMDMDRRFENVG